MLTESTRLERLRDSGGFSGVYRAWLSDSSVDAIFRLPAFDPYVLVDGTVVANHSSDLTDGTLQNPIDRDESGNPLSGVEVWTGTQENGLGWPPQCQDWTSGGTGDSGVFGRTDFSNAQWTNHFLTDCGNALHLYCVEQ